MNFKYLIEQDDAVSPVIGVILMVAITVILAAVIGTFVLGLGDQVQQTAPTAQISGDQGATELYDTSNYHNLKTFTVEHGGGDGLNADNVQVTVNGNAAYEMDGNDASLIWDSSEDIQAGSSTTIIGYYSGTGDPTATFSPVNNSNTNPYPDADESFTGDLGALNSDDTVRVTWTAEDGDRSATLLERDIN